MQERNERIELVWFERGGEGGHVRPAIHDPNDHLIGRQAVADGGEIGAPSAAEPRHRVTVLAPALVKELGAAAYHGISSR
jgi:hypothetical protein